MPFFGEPDTTKLAAKNNIKGLSKALRYKKDRVVCQNAARALGRIGDARAVEPLIGALAGRGACEDVARALGRIGDARAAEPLRTALTDPDRLVPRYAAHALEKPGRRPQRGAAGAAYLAAVGEWDKCVEMGAPAVESLIVALKDWDSGVRTNAAESLAAIYRSGKLDDAQKAKVLAHRSRITKEHNDVSPLRGRSHRCPCGLP